MSDIADRLQNVDARDGAAIALLRYLAKELGKGSAVFNKRLGDGIDEINLYATMEPLAAIIAEAPGHLPAILSLGLMAFAGHAPLYKAVCEVNAIPADSNRKFKEEQSLEMGSRKFTKGVGSCRASICF